MKLERMALWLLSPLTLALVLSGCISSLASTPVPKPGKIAFSSIRDGNGEIYVMNADGTGLVNLTQNPADALSPAWSPDGTRIAFASNRDGGGITPLNKLYEIYVMNADGTEPIKLTINRERDAVPTWSPDGQWIAFQSHRDRNEEIYVMRANGRGQANLTDNPANDMHPDWSP